MICKIKMLTTNPEAEFRGNGILGWTIKGGMIVKYSEARSGRIFVIRLEDGDIVHEEIEKFATEKSIKAATLTIVGGADLGSRIIVGPEKGRENPVKPMGHSLEDVHEITGSGTLFPDDEGNPVLHMHMACGRNESTVTGCIREGVKVWQIMEVVMTELIDSSAVRRLDKATGFKLLEA